MNGNTYMTEAMARKMLPPGSRLRTDAAGLAIGSIDLQRQTF
jgi:hypothetical protein